MKIGIMGGTFNPIHNGHLILSEYIREHIGLDKVIFIPSGNPPHKKEEDILLGKCRKDMVKLAIESNDSFELSTIELDNDRLSYTIDTLEILKAKYPEDELYLLLGGDSLFTLDKWKDFDKIIETIKIVVVDRYDYNGRKIEEKITSLNKEYNGKIEKVLCPIIQISSTEIRKRVKSSESIKYLVPESVERYITDNRLYKDR